MKSKLWRSLLYRDAPNIEALTSLANSFTTCAIGEQLKFPTVDEYRNKNIDRKLSKQANKLAMEFYDAIRSGNINLAKKLLTKIEKVKLYK